PRLGRPPAQATPSAPAMPALPTTHSPITVLPCLPSRPSFLHAACPLPTPSTCLLPHPSPLPTRQPATCPLPHLPVLPPASPYAAPANHAPCPPAHRAAPTRCPMLAVGQLRQTVALPRRPPPAANIKGDAASPPRPGKRRSSP